MERNNLIKKGVVISVILLFVSVSVIPSTGTIIEQSSRTLLYNGNILYVGGNGTGNYTRIQDAIDNASNGDTVFVYDDSSPYFEHVIISKSITLEGEDRNTTVIDGNGIGSVVKIRAEGVILTGFTIQRSGNIWYVDVHDAGIDVKTSNNIIYINTIVDNKGVGIVLWDSSDDNIISNNHLINNRGNGILLTGSDYNQISNNYFYNNKEAGIELSYWDQPADFNEIRGNRFIRNIPYGLIIGGGNRNIVINNEFNATIWDSYGIYIHRSGKKGYASFNRIEKNNILHHMVKATFFHAFRNKWLRNFWGESQIFPKIILGEIETLGIFNMDPWSDPRRIMWLNIDWFPAREPYDIEV